MMSLNFILPQFLLKKIKYNSNLQLIKDVIQHINGPQEFQQGFQESSVLDKKVTL